ncbi:NAD(P)H-dependent oxidoreductase [Clostridium sp.]|uniref:flavodoxin family protein n=1 Tax=Clostridium sp. TaxID=1506 RepID=UPI002FC6158C
MKELYVILPNKNISVVLNNMLQAAIKDIKYTIVDNLDSIPDLQNKKLLFVSQVSNVGTDIFILEFFSKLMQKGNHSLKGCTGAVILHSETELGTKRTAQDIIFLANNLGCGFIGHPLIEAISTLKNFLTWQKTLDMSLEEICLKNSQELVKRLMEDNSVILKNPKIVALYSSPHKTSNTLDLWRMVSKNLEYYQVKELQIEAGEVKDCHGCAYKLCTHYGNNNRCFYGGIMTEEVLPSIEVADAVIWLCPNYNDAIAANLTAVINRLTVLYRQMSFHEKSIFAVVVSGSSGSDSITKQLIGALNINKGFRLPPYFSLMAIANDPMAIFKVENIENHSKLFAENIKSGIKILI